MVMSMLQKDCSCHSARSDWPELMTSVLHSNEPTLTASDCACAGVYVAYALVAWCYFTVSIAGYWAFGNTVQVRPGHQ